MKTHKPESSFNSLTFNQNLVHCNAFQNYLATLDTLGLFHSS